MKRPSLAFHRCKFILVQQLFLHRINGLAHVYAFRFVKLHSVNWFGILTIFFYVLENNYWKNYQKPIYRHFSNYRQIIDIEIKLPEIIGDLKELSLSISISKFPGKLLKNYCYRKKLLIADPYLYGTDRLTMFNWFWENLWVWSESGWDWILIFNRTDVKWYRRFSNTYWQTTNVQLILRKPMAMIWGPVRMILIFNGTDVKSCRASYRHTANVHLILRNRSRDVNGYCAQYKLMF